MDDEFDIDDYFWWLFGKVSDGERAEAAIKGAFGKRLTYRKAGM